jgi:hypothetical protein
MAIQSIIRKPTSFEGSQESGWTGEANLFQKDGSLAQSQITAQNTNVPFLKLSAFDNPLPFDATIVGVVLRITGKSQYTANNGFFCSGAGAGGLRLMGITGAVGRGMGAIKSNILATKIVGGDTDKWGADEILVSEANSTEFGVYFQAQNGWTTAQVLSLDCIEAEVFYDDNQPEPPIGGNGPVKPT